MSSHRMNELMGEYQLVQDMATHALKPWIRLTGFDPELLSVLPSWAQLDPNGQDMKDQLNRISPVLYVFMYDGVNVLTTNSGSNPLDTIYHFKRSFIEKAKEMAFVTEDMKQTIAQKEREKEEKIKAEIRKLNADTDTKAYLHHKVKKMKK